MVDPVGTVFWLKNDHKITPNVVKIRNFPIANYWIKIQEWGLACDLWFVFQIANRMPDLIRATIVFSIYLALQSVLWMSNLPMPCITIANSYLSNNFLGPNEVRHAICDLEDKSQITCQTPFSNLDLMKHLYREITGILWVVWRTLYAMSIIPKFVKRIQRKDAKKRREESTFACSPKRIQLYICYGEDERMEKWTLPFSLPPLRLCIFASLRWILNHDCEKGKLLIFFSSSLLFYFSPLSFIFLYLFSFFLSFFLFSFLPLTLHLCTSVSLHWVFFNERMSEIHPVKLFFILWFLLGI